MTTTANGLGELTALAGTDLGHTGWLEITQQRVNTFADATGDHQWIHVDQARAAAGPFGGTIAHGYLTLSLLIPPRRAMVRTPESGVVAVDGLGDAGRLGAPVQLHDEVGG